MRQTNKLIRPRNQPMVSGPETNQWCPAPKPTNGVSFSLYSVESRILGMVVLTDDELIRQGVKRLQVSHATKIRWLQKCAVKPGRQYTVIAYADRCWQMRPVIAACVADVSKFIDESDESGAIIDTIHELVSHHTFLYNEAHELPHDLPRVKRNWADCLGCMTTAEQVAFMHWE